MPRIALLPDITTDRVATRLFVLFLMLHLLMWTLMVILTRHELDSDSLMHFAWGQEWQGSYRLHPPILPWLLALWFKLTGVHSWSYHLLAQLNIILAFVAIWLLVREYLSSSLALVVVCLLEFHPHYSFLSLRLNHSSLLISAWALTSLFLVYAIRRDRLRDWLLCGLFAGIAILTKYYSVTLLAAIAMFFFFTRTGRPYLNRPGPWCAMLILLLMVTLHFAYVFTHRLGTVSHIGDYFLFSSWGIRQQAMSFFVGQLAYLLLPSGIFVFALQRYSNNGHRAVSWFETAKRICDFSDASTEIVLARWLVLFPFFVTAIPAFVLGVDVSSRWGGPIWGLLGFLLVWNFRRQLALGSRRLIVSMAMAYALLLPLLMILAAPFGVYGEKYSFPGKELANAITLRWNDAVKSPLRIVGGGYLAPDSIAFHAPDHPSVLQHLNFVMSPWINRQDIRKHGMAIVCLQKDTLCRRNAQSQFKLDNWQSLQVGGSAKRFSHSREERFLFVFISPIPDKAL